MLKSRIKNDDVKIMVCCHKKSLLQKYIEAQELIVNKLLQYPNIRLFSFYNNHEMICDLYNYINAEHYNEKINSYILECMCRGEYQITFENYHEYLNDFKCFYGNFDYDGYLDKCKDLF